MAIKMLGINENEGGGGGKLRTVGCDVGRKNDDDCNEK